MTPEQQMNIEKLLPYLTNGAAKIEGEDIVTLKQLYREIFNSSITLSCCKNMVFIERLHAYYQKNKPVESPAEIIEHPEGNAGKQVPFKPKSKKG